MWTAYQFVRVDLIIAAMFTIGILGLVTDRLLLSISRRLLRWNTGLRAR
jgi:NitT/TauT family transport system permease protein